jgi:hypothetical protein
LRTEKLAQFPGRGKPAITIAKPYPLLDAGDYVAVCTEADYEWAKRYRAWKVRLVFKPLDYSGRPYIGRLCKFLDLGKNPHAPYAGPRSLFRMLLVEVNGDQPTRPDVVDVSIFLGKKYAIRVENVTTNRDGEALPPEHWYSTIRNIRAVAPSIPLNQWEPTKPINRPTEQLGKPTLARNVTDARARQK